MEKKIIVIGSGPAGLSAALSAAKLGFKVDIIEKAHEAGGHPIYFTCKASDTCVQCGVCLAKEKLQQASDNPDIRIFTDTQIVNVKKQDRFIADIEGPDSTAQIEADAIIAAFGFTPFDPSTLPYGYGLFKDVITTLDMEKKLRIEGKLTKPSDGMPPKKIAFVQCVGSRSAKRPWCSRICCSSAVRTGSMIKNKNFESVEITIFFIDIQTFGKDFEVLYPYAVKNFNMIRSIAGDIIETEKGLKVSFCTDNTEKEEIFDMVILSIGITPAEDTKDIAGLFDLKIEKSGFLSQSQLDGVFAAGTVSGPMNIQQAVASGEKAALDAVNFINSIAK